MKTPLKITELTDEQKARFPEFIDKWTRIGLSTEPLNRPAIEEALKRAYGQANKPPPKLIVCASPLASCLTRGILASVRDSVRDSVSASVSASVLDSVSASVLASVRDSWYWGFGQYESYWLSFYDFMRAVLSIDTSALDGNEQLCREAGWAMLFWDLALVSEKPTCIHRDAQGRLHRDEAAALLHSDGWGVYALHGVRMKPEHVLTPAEQLDPRAILQEPNVEQRRELLRKIGIERFLAVAKHTVLDTRGDYQLLAIDLSDQLRGRTYLKMLNPSIGVWHIEGVSQECQTVEHALNFRKPEPLKQIPVSADGEDWFQQGDVVCWPRNAKSVKPLPTQIT